MTEENVITAVESGRRGRCVILVDGAEVLDLPKDFAERLGLAPGQPLGPERQDEVRHAAALHEAKLAAVRALGRRAQTQAELRRRLVQRGLPEEAVDEVLGWLADRGYLDDQQYAEQRWHALRQRRLGAQGIRWKLQEEGVPRDIAEQVQAERANDLNETELARELCEQRNESLRSVPWPQRRQRLYAFLARRGFGSEAIIEALSRLDLQNEE